MWHGLRRWKRSILAGCDSIADVEAVYGIIGQHNHKDRIKSRPTMPLKAVLFDLDGTLLDSVPAILNSNRQVCIEMGIPYDEVKMRNWIGIPLKAQAHKLVPDRELEFMDVYRKVYRELQDPDTHLFSGTIPMLDSLRAQGYHTGLVTSKNSRGTTRIVDLIGLRDKFDAIISADEVENAKPHPEPILTALEMLNVTPEEAVYVGDSLFDADAAHSAGVKFVAVTWGARTKEDLLLMCPEAIFDTWEDFLVWLGRRG